MLRSFNMVHFHFFTLRSRVEQLKFKGGIFIPTIRLLDDFEGPLDFHGHNI